MLLSHRYKTCSRIELRAGRPIYGYRPYTEICSVSTEDNHFALIDRDRPFMKSDVNEVVQLLLGKRGRVPKANKNREFWWEPEISLPLHRRRFRATATAFCRASRLSSLVRPITFLPLCPFEPFNLSDFGRFPDSEPLSRIGARVRSPAQLPDSGLAPCRGIPGPFSRKTVTVCPCRVMARACV